MSLTTNDYSTATETPSLGAISYQAAYLIDCLEDINEVEYPENTIRLRNVFLAIACHVRDELAAMHDTTNPLKPKGGPNVETRMLGLAAIIRQIFALVRYLHASSPKTTPPGLQNALKELTKSLFPSKNDRPLCIIRPQWKYNLTYVPIKLDLEKITIAGLVDPEQKRPIADILKAAWGNWRKNEIDKLPKEERARRAAELDRALPTRMGILSFAGLDTSDALLYPLLAHELGHFFDFSHAKTLLHLHGDLRKAAKLDLAPLETSDEAMARINDTRNVMTDLVNVCLRELMADQLAFRMMGFSFFVALAEFLKTLPCNTERPLTDPGYPNTLFRLWMIFREIQKDKEPGNITEFLNEHSRSTVGFNKKISLSLISYLKEWENRFEEAEFDGYFAKPYEKDNELLIVEKAVWNSRDVVARVAKQKMSASARATLSVDFFERINRLANDLPPTARNETANSFSEICSATWAYQLLMGDDEEGKKDDLAERRSEYDKTCRLLSKAIELLPSEAPANVTATHLVSAAEPVAKATTTKKKAAQSNPGRGGVLTAPEILRRANLGLDRETRKERIDITPFDPDLVQTSSLDVRLGNWFSVAKKTRLKSIHLDDPADVKLLRGIGREEVFVPIGSSFLLHPGDLVLGITLEFLAIPHDVMAYVEGKSGLGRLGLFPATATQVAPGFHGVIVLELVNSGTVPLELRPGKAIAQIVFQSLSNPVPEGKLYKGQYYCQIKP